jgi:uncharacterized DUF497 family protein
MAYALSVAFEWDDRKNLINEQKHGLSFEEARGLFESRVDYLEIFDSEHSEFEDRFIAVGPIVRGIIVVIYTEREGDIIRIIAARRANKNERSLYRSYMDQYR